MKEVHANKIKYILNKHFYWMYWIFFQLIIASVVFVDITNNSISNSKMFSVVLCFALVELKAIEENFNIFNLIFVITVVATLNLFLKMMR